jgi:hypothetical protein
VYFQTDDYFVFHIFTPYKDESLLLKRVNDVLHVDQIENPGPGFHSLGGQGGGGLDGINIYRRPVDYQDPFCGLIRATTDLPHARLRLFREESFDYNPPCSEKWYKDLLPVKSNHNITFQPRF